MVNVLPLPNSLCNWISPPRDWAIALAIDSPNSTNFPELVERLVAVLRQVVQELELFLGAFDGVVGINRGEEGDSAIATQHPRFRLLGGCAGWLCPNPAHLQPVRFAQQSGKAP